MKKQIFPENFNENGIIEGRGIQISCTNNTFYFAFDAEHLICTGLYYDKDFLIIREKHRCGSPKIETLVPLKNIIFISKDLED